MAKSSVRPTASRPVAVDLFCGAGGMSLGLEQAGFDPLVGVDIDGYHAANHCGEDDCHRTRGFHPGLLNPAPLGLLSPEP